MSIDFTINERVKEQLAKSRYLNSPKDGWYPILTDIIKNFDPPMPLEEFKSNLSSKSHRKSSGTFSKGQASMLWLILSCMAGLASQSFGSGKRIICRAESAIINDRGRLFDGVHAVFVEDKGARLLLEDCLIQWFSNPENGHVETLENKRLRKFPIPGQ